MSDDYPSLLRELHKCRFSDTPNLIFSFRIGADELGTALRAH